MNSPSARLLAALLASAILLAGGAARAADPPHGDCSNCHVPHNAWGTLFSPALNYDLCDVDCDAGSQNQKSDGTCVAAASCSGVCSGLATCDNTHDGVASCNCAVLGNANASTCAAGNCTTGFDLDAACTGKICGAGAGDGQRCGFGNCTVSTDPCGVDNCGAGTHHADTSNSCVADDTICAAQNGCNGVAGACKTTPDNTNESYCDCPLGLAAPDCATCATGWAGVHPSCTAVVCNAGTVGQPCGGGTCNSSGGSSAQEKVTYSNYRLEQNNVAYNGWTAAQAFSGANQSAGEGGATVTQSPANTTAVWQTSVTTQGSGLTYAVWVAAAQGTGGGGPPTLNVTVGGQSAGGVSLGSITPGWYQLTNVTLGAAGSQTVLFECVAGKKACEVDGIHLSSTTSPSNPPSGWSNYAGTNWAQVVSPYNTYTAGVPPTYTCSCNTGYVKSGAPETCDACDTGGGYTARNGACVNTNPCGGVSCVTPGGDPDGACYIDSSDTPRCACPGQYYNGGSGADCDTCTQVGVGSCGCDAGYTKSDADQTCDACAPGYVLHDGVCIDDPCTPNPCDAKGTCYVDGSGQAACDCAGRWFNAGDPLVCDTCGAASFEDPLEAVCRSCHNPVGTASAKVVDNHSCAAGTGNSLSFSGGSVTLTDSEGHFSPTIVGKTIAISGAQNGGNDGSFTITGRPTPTQIVFDNASGASETSSFSWSVEGCRHLFGAGVAQKQVRCNSCHDPHLHQRDNGQYEGTPSAYGKFIRYDIRLPENPTGWRAVVSFYSADSQTAPDYVDLTNHDRVCQVCHTETTKPGTSTARYQRTTIPLPDGGAPDGGWPAAGSGHADTAHNDAKHGPKSCMGCHPHSSPSGHGFFGAGEESSGGQACQTSCHDINMASETTKYRHVMDNVAAAYPQNGQPAAGGGDKNCLQCHADHDIFRGAAGGRGYNLRTAIGTPPTQGGDFANTDYAAGAGICLTCHQNPQTKDQLGQKVDPASTTTPPIAGADYAASPHAYGGVRGTITTGSSEFTVSCVKCHNSDEDSFAYQGDGLDAGPGDDGSYRFALHSANNRRLLSTLGMSSPPADQLGSSFCLRCHSQQSDTNPGGGPAKNTAGKDYYGATAMSARAEKINAELSKPYGHPILDPTLLHKPYGEGAASGWNTGANRHSQCEDCHNPHAARTVAAAANREGQVASYSGSPIGTLTASGSPGWTPNAFTGYSVRIVTGTGAGQYSTIFGNTASALYAAFATAPDTTSRFVIVERGTSSGNLATGPLVGAWSVEPTWPSNSNKILQWNDNGGVANPIQQAGQFNAIATWNRTDSAVTEGGLCIKCHSAYGFGASPPNTTSAAPNSSDAAWNNAKSGTPLQQADIAHAFNPTNLSHHAVFARGNNQPIVSGQASNWNSTWPSLTAGTVTVSGTSVTLNSGAWPTTILPGWFIYVGKTAPCQRTYPSNSCGDAAWREVVSVQSTTQLTIDSGGVDGSGQAFRLTAGLANTFVPPWGPWSKLRCSDCHASDNTTGADPFGPHGSGTKWTLVKATTQVFPYWNGSSVSTVTNTPSDQYHFCLNCHRRDVYGEPALLTPPNTTLSRQFHPADYGRSEGMAKRPTWGIGCMNCHGGARIGGIHGSNLGQGVGGAGGSYSGKRLLNGANWVAVTRSSTAAAGFCWVKGTTDSVDNCGAGHANKRFLGGATCSGDGKAGCANYDYDSNP